MLKFINALFRGYVPELRRIHSLARDYTGRHSENARKAIADHRVNLYCLHYKGTPECVFMTEVASKEPDGSLLRLARGMVLRDI